MKGYVFSKRNWLGLLRWYWHIKAKNGEIICQSETYDSKQAAQKTLRLVRGANKWEIAP